MEPRAPSNGGLPPLPRELDPRGKHRTGPIPRTSARASRTRTSVGNLGRVLSAIVSASLVVYIGFLWSQVHNVDQKVTHIKIESLGGHRTNGSGNGASNGTPRFDIDGKDQNLIIVGNDNRSDLTKAERKLLHTGSDVSLSTDTMMIVHVPADGSKATLISLPRDTYVDIPSYGMNKLNTAFGFGYRDSSGKVDDKRARGADLLVRTVEDLTGLNLDHYVQVGLIGFYRIAKAIHGVPVNLCEAVDDTVEHNLASGEGGGSGLKISAGKHDLNAVQSLEFVRQRHGLKNGDIDRTARQRYFLTAAFRKIASAGVLLNPGKLGNLVDAVDKSLYVDSGLKILDLARQMANLSANNIVGRSIPFDRFWNDSPVGSVEVVDPAKVKSFVKTLINSTNSAYSTAKTVDPASVTVSVVNGGSANGAATTASKTLNGQGFQASIGVDRTSQGATVIEYSAGMEAQAKTLAAYVPGASVQRGDVQVLTLLLGGDGVKVHATPAPSSKPTPDKTKTKSPKAPDAGCIN